MTPAGIEPATFRFVAQHLNHWATVVPEGSEMGLEITTVGLYGFTAHQLLDKINEEKMGGGYKIFNK